MGTSFRGSPLLMRSSPSVPTAPSPSSGRGKVSRRGPFRPGGSRSTSSPPARFEGRGSRALPGVLRMAARISRGGGGLEAAPPGPGLRRGGIRLGAGRALRGAPGRPAVPAGAEQRAGPLEPVPGAARGPGVRGLFGRGPVLPAGPGGGHGEPGPRGDRRGGAGARAGVSAGDAVHRAGAGRFAGGAGDQHPGAGDGPESEAGGDGDPVSAADGDAGARGGGAIGAGGGPPGGAVSVHRPDRGLCSRAATPC